MKRNFVICLLFTSISVFSQNYFYKSFSWEKQPSLYKPSTDEQEAELVMVKDFTVLEVAYDKDGQAVIYETHHRKYHVNNQKGIESVNKVYIPTREVHEELDLKARCIAADGKVIPFSHDNVKRVDNLDNAGPYTIFTIDGVDVGCDVEYVYTNKRNFFAYGLYRINNLLPISSYEFTVISPKNLIYESKTFNGVSPFEKETKDSTKNTLHLSQMNIPVVDDEKYSSSNANRPSFSIQLAYNTDKGNAKFYTWETIAKGYYNTLFFVDKSEQKIIDKFLDKNKISKKGSQEEKIYALENALKLQNNISERDVNLGVVKGLETHNLDRSTALQVYIFAFRQLQIPFELVLTSDRMNKKFDEKYPTMVFLDDILFYFPDINKYTSPLDILSRVEFPDPVNSANEGLFIKEVMLGDIGMPTSKVKKIKPTDYSKSYHNINVKAKFNLDDLKANLEFEQNLMGYSAFYTQPIYDLLNAEQKKDVDKGYYIIPKTDDLKGFTVSNTDKESILLKPLKISYSQESSNVLENAGDKFIFKIGELIGEQAELYQEKKRVSDGEIYYTHFFKRTIEIEIPESYKAMNLDELKMNKKCMIDGKDVAQFTADYTVNGNKIIVNVYEDYREINYPLAIFEDFKQVINAAADFNKKVLVFGKI